MRIVITPELLNCVWLVSAALYLRISLFSRFCVLLVGVILRVLLECIWNLCELLGTALRDELGI